MSEDTHLCTDCGQLWWCGRENCGLETSAQCPKCSDKTLEERLPHRTISSVSAAKRRLVEHSEGRASNSMNAFEKLLSALVVPVGVINSFGGIVAGIWLAILGDWGSIGSGIIILTAVAALWMITFLTSGWVFWLLLLFSVVVTYRVLGLWFYRNASGWRRIYFPLINRYSFLGGAHLEGARSAGVTFTPKNPFGILLKESHPELTDEEISYTLDKWEMEFKAGGDKELFADILSENSVSSQELTLRLEEMREGMLEPENYNGYFVRYAIGEIIDVKLGRDAKKKYWRAIISGKVP